MAGEFSNARLAGIGRSETFLGAIGFVRAVSGGIVGSGRCWAVRCCCRPDGNPRGASYNWPLIVSGWTRDRSSPFVASSGYRGILVYFSVRANVALHSAARPKRSASSALATELFCRVQPRTARGMGSRGIDVHSGRKRVAIKNG